MAPDLTSPESSEEQTRFWEKIGLIAEISTLCREPRPDGTTFVEVLSLIEGMIPFDAGSLYLYDSNLKLGPRAELGGPVTPPSFYIRNPRRPGERSEPRSRQPVLLHREDAPDDFDPDCPYAAVLSMPLLVADEVIGILNLGSYTAGALIRKHVRLLSIVADQLAVSIERLDYIGAVEAKNQELARAHEDIKKAQQKIIAEQKLTAVCELAASVNHEINNPLSVILGHVQCLQLELTEADPKTRTRFERIEQAAMRIGEVNRGLLKIDKLIPRKHLSGSDRRLLDLDPSVPR